MLDIQKLTYLKTIAENDFNITQASKELFISQPALSKMIQSIETEENLDLFVRRNSRLVGFTPSGQKLYEEANILLHNYYNMMEKIRHTKTHYKENIKIAAPPFLLRVYFSHLISSIQEKFPDILFSYFESDQNDVRENIIKQAYDLALMTEPSDYCLYGIKQTPLDHSTFCGFISKKHPYKDKEFLTWKDISQFPITLPGNRYSTSKLILNAIQKESLNPEIALTGSLWDFQISMAFNGKNIAILPEFTKIFYTKEMEENILYKKIKNTVSWDVSLCERKGIDEGSNLEKVKYYILSQLKNIYGKSENKR